MRKFKYFILTAAVIASAALLVWNGFLREQVDLYLYPIKYTDIVEACARKYDIPSEMVYAVIHTESSFEEGAVSRVGAKGLMQIIDETNEWIALVKGEDVMPERIFEPEVNIDRGTWLLSYLYREFGAWNEALAAYNAGIGRVRGWLDDANISTDGVTLDRIPFDETAAYVTKVMKAVQKYRELYFE